MPIVTARHFKDGVFTAAGGAVWFETERPAAGSGLIEGATPECRGPREVLRYQRAQDRLLSEAARDCPVAGGFRLVKNDRDAWDNVYGAQENYEVRLASGWRLLVWRAGAVCLVPLALLTWVGFLLLTAAMITYLILAGLVYVPLQCLVRDPQRLALALFGADFVHGREMGCLTPRWLEAVVQAATRAITLPLALALWALAWLCAFIDVRRQLTAFLVSRVIYTGAGMIDRQGRFLLADKAPAINCVLGYGGLFRDRPLITLGHFFKSLSADAWFSPYEFVDLLGERQRLQIGAGDSNMAETAEYLRVGVTLLVLDALEGGAFKNAPRLKRPIAALQAFCRDPRLETEVAMVGGARATALQLQLYYLKVCREFLEQSAEVPAEAWNVLRLWQQTLEDLDRRPAEPDESCPLLGRLDWVTKRYLLAQAAQDASWEQKKKIDIRYHELSEAGYFQLLVDAGLVPAILEADEIERSLRNPPPDSPATMRGHYIREFSQGGEPLTANWKTVVLGKGRRARTIRLADYGRRRKRKPPGKEPAASRP